MNISKKISIKNSVKKLSVILSVIAVFGVSYSAYAQCHGVPTQANQILYVPHNVMPGTIQYNQSAAFTSVPVFCGIMGGPHIQLQQPAAYYTPYPMYQPPESFAVQAPQPMLNYYPMPNPCVAPPIPAPYYGYWMPQNMYENAYLPNNTILQAQYQTPVLQNSYAQQYQQYAQAPQYGQYMQSPQFSAAPYQAQYGRLFQDRNIAQQQQQAGLYQMTPEQYQQIAMYYAMQQQAQQQMNSQQTQPQQLPFTYSVSNGDSSGEQTADNANMPKIIVSILPDGSVGAQGNMPYPTGVNPAMMGGMGWGYNPMMNQFGGLGQMPPIIVLQNDSGRRRGFGSRRREQRESKDNWMQASPISSMDAQRALCQLWSTPYNSPNTPLRMPSASAFPYGQFGASVAPQSANNFGGYYNAYRAGTTFPGL